MTWLRTEPRSDVIHSTNYYRPKTEILFVQSIDTSQQENQEFVPQSEHSTVVYLDSSSSIFCNLLQPFYFLSITLLSPTT